MRRVDDDQSAIYGTVGYQAPEVADVGPERRRATSSRSAAPSPCSPWSSAATRSTYVATPAAGRRHAALPALRLALPRAARRPPRRIPTTASSPPTSCATSCSACCARWWRSTAASAAAAHSSPVGAVRRADRRRRRPRAGRICRCCAIDRADPSATWLAGVSLARRRRSGSRCSSRRPSRPSRCSSRRRAPRSTPALFPTPTSVIERHARPTNPWEWRAVWLSGLAALARDRLRRRRDRVQHRARAGARRARAQARARARLRARRAPTTSPNSSTRCAPRPTPTTSRRRRSAWPARARTGATPPAASPPSISSRPTSGAYVARSPPARRAAHARRAAASTISPRPRRASRTSRSTARDRQTIARRDLHRARSTRSSRPASSRRYDDRRRRGHGDRPARRGRAGVPRARGPHVGSRRAHPSRRRGEHRPAPDARVTDCARTAARPSRRPTSSASRAARRWSPRRTPTSRSPPPSNRRSSRTPRRRTHRRRRPTAPSLPEDTGPRRCSCGGEIDADGWCTVCGLRAAPSSVTTTPSSRHPTSRRSATAGMRAPAERGRGRARRVATTGSCSSSATACRAPRPTATSRRPPRPAPPATCSSAAPEPPARSPAALIEHWIARARSARSAPRRTRPRLPRRRSATSRTRRRARSSPRSSTGRCSWPAWVGDSRCYWFGDDGTATPALGRRLVGERARSPRASPARSPRPIRGPMPSPAGSASTVPAATRRPPAHRFAVGARGWVLVCSDGLWNYCSAAPELRRSRCTTRSRGLGDDPLAVGVGTVRLGERAGWPRQRHGGAGPPHRPQWRPRKPPDRKRSNGNGRTGRPRSSRTNTCPPTPPTCTRSSPSTCQGAGAAGQSGAAAEVIIVDTSGSMSSPHTKIVAARQAAAAAIDEIVDGTWFAVISGDHAATVVYPDGERDDASRRADRAPTPKRRSQHLDASGGTAIGSWLDAATSLFRRSKTAQRHAILLTDGKNETETPEELRSSDRAAHRGVPVRLPRRRRRLGRQRAPGHRVGAARLRRHHRRARRRWPRTSGR